MPRRKVPGADYAARDIDPRDLPADVEEIGSWPWAGLRARSR